MIRYKKEHGTLIVIGVLLAFYVYGKDPSKGPILPCVFQKITGLYCPGCGMTRAVNALMHFDFLSAFQYNILPFILAPFFLMYFFKKKAQKKADHLIYMMISLSLLFFILRNTSWFLFLAPA